MNIRRIGTAWGEDEAGSARFVSVYRDGGGLKLCGPDGSCLVPARDAAAIREAVTARFGLSNVEFAESRRAA